MTKKKGVFSATPSEPLKIAEAVEQYVAQGGVINVVPEGESGEMACETTKIAQEMDPEAQMKAKLEQLKGLVAKGAGVSALQYSLRMNRKEIKRLANEHGLKILYSRPVRSRPARSRETGVIDDTVAGHAMHYSSLGYTAQEIAQLLDLSVRDVWNIGKAYRFEFKSPAKIDTAADLSSDLPEPEK
ncbi:hypothetical protein SAMN03159444_05004 [Pseudomonas sp. NFACC02]|uniref:hypothetical protein n=1 Tax=Pseudomonas sp. NFACC02 TaxID=1566250 RepID=UPI0008C4C647|nr:hypothetical protein [Pseudomonas sp. NFACC02]SER77220.1 hypothetical protein SAMN03159444_05004 [Pseudomonas sp. NFACC02]